MTKKLNEEYFETKKKRKGNYRRKKLTVKRIVLNLIMTIVFIVIYNVFLKKCSGKIEENKRNDILNVKY
ncbi:hypothetical protein SAMN04489761_3540 [Tenacibaculum sp. MAR_2009_124]|uniref:hypothetical protein n=1 Tax=Tenacibaculum sp. MAR_2009_124 TaxID=1250059 RepID=UPI00089D9834|nr:hypothetical protein [Tenacibaculum sp. MAR_2009_124]SEC77478.1 hypothetical protein SAMN04489761_3540 [Tenacibaculum sp. MAR_2009_124]